MASSIHILDNKGAPLIARSYRGDIGFPVDKVFSLKILDEPEDAKIKPVFEHEGHTLVWMRHNDVFIVTTSKINCIPALHIRFMEKMVEVFNGYFNAVNEESVRDNFVIIYELLDEMADFGYPQYTEEKILQEFVTQEGFKLQLFDDDKMEVKALPQAVTGAGGASQYRQPGIKHRKNEVFLDVIEAVNMLVGQDGETLHSEINGTLKMRVQLSGMPDVKLGLNEKVLGGAAAGAGAGGAARPGKTVELEDINFHSCVRLNKFESDRIISFCPPEGEFDLMNYRLSQKLRPLIHIDVETVKHGSSRVEMLLKARSTFKKTSNATVVEVAIPLPPDAENVTAKANNGAVQWKPEVESLMWTVNQFPGGREFMCKCQYTVPSVRTADPAAAAKRPIGVKFEIPYFTVSGFQVRYLKVTEKSGYETFPWVRYVTKSGDYLVRRS